MAHSTHSTGALVEEAQLARASTLQPLLACPNAAAPGASSTTWKCR